MIRDYLDVASDVLGRSLLEATGRMGRMASNVSADVKENDEKYTVILSAAGYNKDMISVDYENGILSVSGEMETESEDDSRGYLVRERAHGSFNRAFRILGVDEDAIKAKMEDGVLTITLPKVEKPAPKGIKIE